MSADIRSAVPLPSVVREMPLLYVMIGALAVLILVPAFVLLLSRPLAKRG